MGRGGFLIDNWFKMKNFRPITVGSYYYVTFSKNNEAYPAEVIDKRPLVKEGMHGVPDSSSSRKRGISTTKERQNESDFEYYVHYVNFDRRLDEWVAHDKFDLETQIEEADELASAALKNTHKKSRRKLSNLEGLSGASELAELEKQHDELTKVKNIQCIELGR